MRPWSVFNVTGHAINEVSIERGRTVSLHKGLLVQSDLPLNFHPAGTGALLVDTPIGADGATDRCAELSSGAARRSVAVNRPSANALGVW